jgi:hypothetical protein
MLEKEHLALPTLDDTGHNEAKLDKQIDQIKNINLQGSILFSSKPIKKKKPFRWIRIRSFFTKHKKFKRLVEFSIHPTGIHMLRLAMFHSENGCGMCKVYVEMNLF